MAAQVFLLGLCSAYTPGKQPPKAGVRTPTTAAASPPPADIAMATQQAVAGVAEKSQNLVASLFEWEHERAAKYERYGTSTPYWSDPRIHNFGNTGLRGFLHALVVPFATHMIDRFAYDNTDARKMLHETEFPADATVVDFCSGVGFSPARNGHVTCVDTSEEMLAVARIRRPDVQRFARGNAEKWGFSDSFDIATVMYGMHEMPAYARRRVIRNALRVAKDKVMIVDIWPGFQPTKMMLSGEPYVLDYLAHIEEDMDVSYDPTEWSLERVDVVGEHVRMWKFERLDWGI